MSFKLLALDLDDTLLNDKFAISPRNREAILEATRKGITVTLATGRMFRSALTYARELDLDVPLITYHGALVKKAYSGEEIYHCPVPLKEAQEITAYLEERGCHLNLYVNDNLYVREDNHLTRYYVKIANVDFTSVGDLSKFLKEEPTKMTIINKDEVKLRQLWDNFKERYGQLLSIGLSRPYFLEITHARATKGQALSSLAHSLGVKREEIMAVGDSYNDIDMIKLAGMGVAVENGRQEVKEAADYITSSHQEDGVAEVVERFILS